MDAETVQALPLLRDHGEALEEVQPLHRDPGLGLHEGLPGTFHRVVHGRRDDAKLLGSLVGAEVEQAIPVIHLVLVALFPRKHRLEGAFGLIGSQDPHFIGVRAGKGEHQELAIPGAGQIHAEQLILLLEHEFRLGPQAQAPDLIRALGHGIFGGVEEGLPVGSPFHAGHPLRGVRQEAARGQILHPQRVLAVPRFIGGVGQSGIVVADGTVPQAKEGLALGQFVLVQVDLLRRLHAAFPAAEDGVLLPFHGAAVVEEPVVEGGHAEVRLLDAAQQFLVKALLEGLESAGLGFGEGILGLQVGRHLGVLLLPQPEVGIPEGLAVPGLGVGHLLGDRRHGGLRSGKDRDGKTADSEKGLHGHSLCAGHSIMRSWAPQGTGTQRAGPEARPCLHSWNVQR